MLKRLLVVVVVVLVVGNGAVLLAQEALMTELAPAALKEELTAAREWIDKLPKQACGLTLEWDKLTKLFDDKIERVEGRPLGGENLSIFQGLGDLRSLIQTYEWESEEVCAHDKQFRDLEQPVRQRRRQVLSSFSRVVKDIRGNKFPFWTFSQFSTWYEDVNWWEKRRQTNSFTVMTEIRLGKLRVNSVRKKYEYFKKSAKVDNGRVHVRLPGGSQRMWENFDKGLPHAFMVNPFVWGAALFRSDAARMANELDYGVTESLYGGLQLSFAQHNLNCRGKSSAYSCAGSTLRRLEAAKGGYRLSTMVRRQMEAALQEHVTAACERRVADGSAILEIIDAHRPKKDQSVQGIYDRAAVGFQARVAQLKASGTQEMCGPEKSEFLLGLAEVAVDSAARIRPGAVSTTNENWHRKLQREFDEMVKYWSCGHVLPPRFPASPKATCEMAGVRPGASAPTRNGTGAGDNARPETAPQVNSGREHDRVAAEAEARQAYDELVAGYERLVEAAEQDSGAGLFGKISTLGVNILLSAADDLLARASDRSLPASARVSFAARAAQGFRSAVEAHVAGRSDAIGAAHQVRKYAVAARQARMRVGSSSDTTAGVQEQVNVALNAARKARAIAQEYE